MNRYTKFTCDKLRSYASAYSADTIYLGGGTPGILGTERLCEILNTASESFGQAKECTMEVNPRSAMQLDFEKLRSYGLNRVSMGLQSANDNELRILGRRHTLKDAQNAAEKIRCEGITNLSLDLMIGISCQTMESLGSSIDMCKEMGARHISAYMLTIEEGTPYYKMRPTLNLPDEDTVCKMYEFTVQKLSECGYHQYEISNFSQIGYESRHNLKYWRCEEYLGLGPAAHSFIDGRRSYCPRSIDNYYKGVIIPDGEGGGQEEYISLALRLNEGLRYHDYEKRYGEPVPENLISCARRFEKHGYVKILNDSICLTTNGFLVSNTIISELICGLQRVAPAGSSHTN